MDLVGWWCQVCLSVSGCVSVQVSFRRVHSAKKAPTREHNLVNGIDKSPPKRAMTLRARTDECSRDRGPETENLSTCVGCCGTESTDPHESWGHRVPMTHEGLDGEDRNCKVSLGKLLVPDRQVWWVCSFLWLMTGQEDRERSGLCKAREQEEVERGSGSGTNRGGTRPKHVNRKKQD